MGRNADNGHVGFTVFQRIGKLDNLDQCLIPCEILSHCDGESKLLEETLKASCVRCRSDPGKTLCILPLASDRPSVSETIPLSVERWAGKGLIVNDEGETSWSGNHCVNLIYVREKHPEGAAIHNIVTSNNAPAKSKIGTQKQLEKL